MTPHGAFRGGIRNWRRSSSVSISPRSSTVLIPWFNAWPEGSASSSHALRLQPPDPVVDRRDHRHDPVLAREYQRHLMPDEQIANHVQANRVKRQADPLGGNLLLEGR